MPLSQSLPLYISITFLYIHVFKQVNLKGFQSMEMCLPTLLGVHGDYLLSSILVTS